MSQKFNLPCILCWDEGVVAGTINTLPGYPEEFLKLPEEERGKLSREALCSRHKGTPGIRLRSSAS